MKFLKIKINFYGVILLALSSILLLAASNTQSGWQYIISAFLFSIVFIGLICPLLYLKNVELSKYVPSRTFVGKVTTIEIIIKNSSNKLKRYFSIDDLPVNIIKTSSFKLSSFNFKTLMHLSFPLKSLIKNDINCFFLRLIAAKDLVDFKYTFIPAKRGVYIAGNTVISTSSPLGVFNVAKTFKFNNEVVIYPKSLDIRGGWVNRIAQKSIVNQVSYRYAPVNMPAITRSVREYVPGDSPRYIHWPTSAKINKLFVKEFEIESSGHIVILLDCCNEYESEELFELAVTTATSLLNISHQSGLVTRFVTQEDSYKHFGTFKNSVWNSQLEVLARVQPISKKKICTYIDQFHQDLIAKNPGFIPTYVLISPVYRADFSANKANIISINVSPRQNEFSHYTISSELDLQYI